VKQLAARQSVSVEIRAEKAAPIKWVVAVMDACKAAGIERVSKLATPPTAAMSAGAQFQFRLVAAEGDTNSPADVLSEARDEHRSESHRVLKTILLGERAVENAVLATNDFGKSIRFQLTTEGARKFADVTGQNIGRRLAMVWNGRVLVAPVIRSAISSGACEINGVFTDAEARQLLDVLNHRSGSTQTNAISSP
jgi:preprotein translocase subunit SecD